MNIIVVGCGKVGVELAARLSEEGHAVTMLDSNGKKLQEKIGSLDVQGVCGNGTSYKDLMEAGVLQADLMIAVTDSDEINMLSCLIARKAGNCQTIARVRKPEYFEQIRFIKEELGLSLAINPDLAAAADIARLIQVPSAMEIDAFAKGRVNLVRFALPEDSPAVGVTLAELSRKLNVDVHICMIERDDNVIIPDGGQRIEKGDSLWIVVNLTTISKVFRAFGLRTRPVKSVMIAGGGRVSQYLAQTLLRSHVRVKIIETDEAKCEMISEQISGVEVAHGDATSETLLREEGIADTDAFVSLTNIDEENILLSLYAQKVSNAKLVTKITRIAFEEVIRDMPLGSVVCPRTITTGRILRYVRSMENASGSNVETLYYLAKGRAEALEFKVREGTKKSNRILNVPLMNLDLKKELLISCIIRDGKPITPSGRDFLQIGDTVIVITTHKGLTDLSDILKD